MNNKKVYMHICHYVGLSQEDLFVIVCDSFTKNMKGLKVQAFQNAEIVDTHTQRLL